jgi:phosphatidylserine/phosphatidylglycerophosphate/cardiolipin synthase-like enzyme
MKLIHSTMLSLLVLSSCSNWNWRKEKVSPERVIASNTASPDALMSPMEGELAFNRVYELIGEAKKYVHISVYSWSDSGLEKAIEKALANKARVRVVLHPDLKESPKVETVVPKLEAMGAEFKISPLNMHEKFTLIDDETVVNTSANFSGGAKTKYSENMVFHESSKDNSESLKSLIKDFKNEFVILWNTSKDIVTNKEANAERLTEVIKKENVPATNSDMTLYSSSMNWTLKENSPTSVMYKAGKYQTLVKKTYANSAEQTWVVRDALISAIKGANKSIYLSLNHFNIRAVSDALIEAVKRGVDVKLAVDNQEYKSKPNDLEMSPQFVYDYKALKGAKEVPPVRVKYYSHEPSPRSWLLNHHKFILVDYEVADKTVLLSGSYNLSATAEQNQFDNLVVYKTPKYKELYESFYKEFKNQWSWNRVNDLPKKEVVDLFFTTKNNSYPVHITEAVALTWPEVMNLRAEVNKKAPGIFSGLTKNRDCLYYDPAKKAYWACPNGK